MPAVFHRHGIHFQYPENWTLETDEGAKGCRGASVYSSGGGFWAVTVHPREEDPRALAKAALETIKREYDELDSEPASEKIGAHELAGYDLNFYCLDLTNTAWIRGFRTAKSTLLVICQAEDREFDQVADVFRAITASLLR